MDEIEDHFAADGPTPKGRAALRAIFRATREAVRDTGLAHASLEDIAGRAGMSQAALRHYFPTRDELLFTFFVRATDWYRVRTEALLKEGNLAAREKLSRCMEWHLAYMESVDTTFWMESSAYWLRDATARGARDAFYHWLSGLYGALIAAARPGLDAAERDRRTYAVLTLVLGAWVTHGRGSSVEWIVPPEDQRAALIATAMDIALR